MPISLHRVEWCDDWIPNGNLAKKNQLGWVKIRMVWWIMDGLLMNVWSWVVWLWMIDDGVFWKSDDFLRSVLIITIVLLSSIIAVVHIIVVISIVVAVIIYIYIYLCFICTVVYHGMSLLWSSFLSFIVIVIITFVYLLLSLIIATLVFVVVTITLVIVAIIVSFTIATNIIVIILIVLALIFSVIIAVIVVLHSFLYFRTRNSRHQDDYIFSRGPYKSSLATVTGRGASKYVQISCTLYIIIIIVIIMVIIGKELFQNWQFELARVSGETLVLTHGYMMVNHRIGVQEPATIGCSLDHWQVYELRLRTETLKIGGAGSIWKVQMGSHEYSHVSSVWEVFFFHGCRWIVLCDGSPCRVGDWIVDGMIGVFRGDTCIQDSDKNS